MIRNLHVRSWANLDWLGEAEIPVAVDYIDQLPRVTVNCCKFYILYVYTVDGY